MAHLELTDGDLRDVLCGRPDSLIADINSVHFDPRRPSEMSRERDGGEAVLRGVEIGAILNLNARLELSEIKKVPPVDREILNLLRSEHALYRRLFGIHGNRRALHGDDCSF